MIKQTIKSQLTLIRLFLQQRKHLKTITFHSFSNRTQVYYLTVEAFLTQRHTTAVYRSNKLISSLVVDQFY